MRTDPVAQAQTWSLAPAPRFHAGPVHAAGEPWWAQWDLRMEVLVVLGLCLLVYTLGWRRLRRGGHASLASGPRLTAYLVAIASLALALVGPLDTLQERSFAVHMVQHLILKMVAPPLLWLALPFSIGLWSLPAGARGAIGRGLAPGGPARPFLERLSHPWLALVLCMGTLYLWHVPAAYGAVFRSEAVHDIEHLTFFGAALLFWWQVTAAPPRLRGSLPYGLRIGLVLVAMALNTALAITLAMADAPFYAHYGQVERLGGLTALEDQQLGGAIMWIPGGMMYGMTAIFLLAAMLEAESRAQRRRARPRPASPAAAAAAPGS